MSARVNLVSRFIVLLVPAFALAAAALANALQRRLGLDLDERGRAIFLSSIVLTTGGAAGKWLEGRGRWEQAQTLAEVEFMRHEAPADPVTGVREDELERDAKLGLEEDLAEIQSAEPPESPNP